ncbi:MAG: amino acid adenylation domain-containing protein [Cyclobacteriaceae bacterium]|jgi:amino acid adenylation domain-containing protein
MADSVIKKKLTQDYWLDKLQLDNPTYNNIFLEKSNGVELESFQLKDQSIIQFQEKFQRNHERKFSVLFAAFSLLLHKCFDSDEVIIAIPDINIINGEDTKFYFQRVCYNSHDTLKEYTSSAYAEYQQSLKYGSLSIVDLKKYLENDKINKRVFNYAFEYTPLSTHEVLVNDFGMVLKVNYFDDKGLSFDILYNSKVYSQNIIKRLGHQYSHFLSSWSEYWSSGLRDIALHRKESYGQSAQDEKDETSIISLFKSQVDRQAEKVAFVHDNISFTYADIDYKTNQLATYLVQECGIEKDDLVGIYLDDSEYLLISIIAILKAGGAFVPLKPGQTDEHIKFVVKDTQMKAMLLGSEHMLDLEYYEGHFFALDIQLDTLDYHEQEVEVAKRSKSHLAYAIYTSGTTGRPKGVLIEDKSVVDYALWLKEDFAVGEKDIAILLSSPIFDLAYTVIWGSILLGGTLHQLSKEISLHLDYYVKEILNREITFIKATPSLFDLLLNLKSFDKHRLLLKHIFLGGEVLTNEVILKYKKALPKVQIINHYGPTEATVGVLANIVDDTLSDLNNDISVIGVSKKNTQCLLLSSENQEALDGFSGEICIEGSGLARGYLNNIDLTDKRFIKHPYRQDCFIYKTGDHGRKLEDGRVVFEGRKDRQIKRRGFRVELDGIEAIIKGHSEVETCVVTTKEIASECKVIAFIKGVVKELNDLDKFFIHNMPSFMIPDQCIFVNNMPMLANGKIDVKKLVANNTVLHSSSKINYVSPENEVEIFLADKFSEVLKLDRVGLNDNFFDIGASSISLIQINTLINERYPSVSIVDLFNYPTIAKLARFIIKGEDESKIQIDDKLVRLPENYLNLDDDGSDKKADLKFKIKEEVFRKLQKTARNEGFTYYDVFIALFAYVFYETSNQNQIPVFVLNSDNSIIKIIVDFSSFDTPVSLVKYVAESRKTEGSFGLNQLSKIKFTDNHLGAVAPFIFRVSDLETSMAGLKPFDLVLRVEDTEADNVGFVLECGDLKIIDDKAKDLLVTFNALIKSFTGV